MVATPAQAHYLGGVLRRAAGDPVLLLNGRDGEWAARVAALKPRPRFPGPRASDPPAGARPRSPPSDRRGEAPGDGMDRREGDGAGRRRSSSRCFTRRSVSDRVNTARLAGIAREAAGAVRPPPGAGGRASAPPPRRPGRLGRRRPAGGRRAAGVAAAPGRPRGEGACRSAGWSARKGASSGRNLTTSAGVPLLPPPPSARACCGPKRRRSPASRWCRRWPGIGALQRAGPTLAQALLSEHGRAGCPIRAKRT